MVNVYLYHVYLFRATTAVNYTKHVKFFVLSRFKFFKSSIQRVFCFIHFNLESIKIPIVRL